MSENGLIWAVYGSAGGTRYTLEYAMRRGLDIVDLPIVTGAQAKL